eukprot:TRINITY_DN6779_c0_g1_i1.p1 TRINITY_DN6779_c0_g1~~TRINITY_DN6779_c0_g1_i1.p1  ORF type:complete len:973 (+),score=227.17 TRINITY_DN6779_c0_g1_i1:175-3093(+)
MIDGDSPFKSLQKKCQNFASSLAERMVYVAIFGRLKVGKSTLGNALIGSEIFPTKRTPATSCSCIVRSGSFSFTGDVTFSPSVETIEDVSNIFKNANYDNMQLEFFLKDLVERPHVQLQDIERVVAFPSVLRDYNIIDRVDFTMPVMGIEEPGFGFIDCTGTSENELLNFSALYAIQHASVILYVLQTRTSISDKDDDIRNIKHQMELGTDVIFILNVDEKDTFEDIEEKIQDFKSVFGQDNHLHVVDLVQDLEEPQFAFIQECIFTLVENRIETMVNDFLVFFEKLLKIQHLFLSRIVSIHVDRKVKLYQNEQNNDSREIVEESIKNLRSTIKALEKSALEKIEHDKIEFKDWFNHEIEMFKRYVLEEDILSDITLSEEYIPPEKYLNIFRPSIGGRTLTPYEEELKRQLQHLFERRITTKLFDYTTEKKLSFANWILENVQEIQTESADLRVKLEQEIWTKNTIDFFTDVESNMHIKHTNNLKLSVPGLISITGVAGAGAFGGAVFAGLLSASIATGGGILFGLLALGGFGGILKSLNPAAWSSPSEFETREKLFKWWCSSFSKSVSTVEFLNSAESKFFGQRPDFVRVIKDTLMLSILEIESLSQFDNIEINLDYESLCNCIQIREDLVEYIMRIKEENILNEWNFSTFKNSIKDRELIGRMDDCFVCNEKIKRCGHLCRRCDFVFGDSCPYCTHPNWIITRLRPDDDKLNNIITQYLENVSWSNEKEDNYGIRRGNEALLESEMEAYKSLVEQFCQYWIQEYQNAPIKDSIPPINYLISKIIMSYTPKEGGLPYVMKRQIVRILHRLIFPHVYEVLSHSYENMYNYENIEFVLACNQASELPFPSTLKNEEGEHWTKAVQNLKTMSKAKTPFEKLVCICSMYSSIIKANSPMLMDADLSAEAITYVMARAKYPKMYSDIKLIQDTLGEFVGSDQIYIDKYLLLTVGALCTDFKYITEYMINEYEESKV